jgi:hypothetical protein
MFLRGCDRSIFSTGKPSHACFAFPCYWNGGGNGLESHLRYFIKRFGLTLDLIQSPIQDEIPYIGTFVDLEQKAG